MSAERFKAIAMGDMMDTAWIDADFPIQAIFRHARLLRIGAGSDEIMKFLIAREILKEIKG
jgi:alkylation response protein AidB-like acyl-CoA dehydrogenase